eukprot:XP_022272272.1 ankyrin repeat domain-containing protein 26-like isoform X1 [Canis lupus familiaris]
MNTCICRLTLKQEKEKRRSAEILYINIKEQLRSKEELSERQEAKELQTKVVRCIQKFRDDIKKLEVENAELKVTVKEQAGQIEQLQKDLLSSSSA